MLEWKACFAIKTRKYEVPNFKILSMERVKDLTVDAGHGQDEKASDRKWGRHFEGLECMVSDSPRWFRPVEVYLCREKRDHYRDKPSGPCLLSDRLRGTLHPCKRKRHTTHWVSITWVPFEENCMVRRYSWIQRINDVALRDCRSMKAADFNQGNGESTCDNLNFGLLLLRNEGHQWRLFLKMSRVTFFTLCLARQIIVKCFLRVIIVLVFFSYIFVAFSSLTSTGSECHDRGVRGEPQLLTRL